MHPDAARPDWPFWRTAGLFAAAWVILTFPWLSGRVTIPWDAKAHFYPQLQFLAQSLHRGESPFWNPFVFAGHPQIADPQSLIFSPPYLLLALLTPDPSFAQADAVVFGMLGLGALAVIARFRDLGWHPLGALVAALAFAFGASAAWRIQHVGQVVSLAYLPIAWLFLMRALERGSVTAGALAGLAAGLMALGRDQVAMLGLWVLAGAVLWWTIDPWRTGLARGRAAMRATGPLVAGALVGALVVTIPFGLTALLAEHSNRPVISYGGAAAGSLHPALVLSAWIPNLYGADGPLAHHWGPPSPLWGPTDLYLARNMGQLYLGALPLVLLAIGAARGWLAAREIRFVTLAFVVMLLYALGRGTPAFAALYHAVPGVDLFRRPADATFLIGALGAILAGYVLHRIASGEDGPSSVAQAFVAAGLVTAPVAIGLSLALAKGTLPLAAWPLATGIAFLALAALLVVILGFGRVAGFTAMALVAGFLTLDLAVNNGPNESTALPPATFSVLRTGDGEPLIRALRARLPAGSLDRVELAGIDFHWPNASLTHRLFHTLGYNPIRLGLYSRATGAEDHVALPDQRKFSALMPGYGSRLADLLGLRFIATGLPVEAIDHALRPGELKSLGQFGKAHLYETPRALPRVLFATQALAVDQDQLVESGAWPDVDPRHTVLLGRAGGAPPVGESSARITSYANTRVSVAVDAAQDGWVVLNDVHHPWWTARVDGAPVAIERANGLFRAVPVPAGRHRVEFVFRPLSGAWRDLTGR